MLSITKRILSINADLCEMRWGLTLPCYYIYGPKRPRKRKEAIRMKKKNAFMMYALCLLMNKSTPFPYN